MYTPYEGPDLLRAFMDDRLQFLDRLQRATSVISPNAEQEAQARQISADGNGPNPLSTRTIVVLPTHPRQEPFETLPLLLHLWSCELHGSEDMRTLAREWEGVLLGRYEITKRLYTRYTETLRADSDDWSPLEPYALLSALLARRYAEAGNLKYLNAMLKLKDLLSSAQAEEHGPLTTHGALVAVRAEIDAFQALISVHGVAL